jgi:FtsZ-binding cell division protein ZapB
LEDSFKLLEDKIRQAADRLKELRAENESLGVDLEKAVERAEKAESALARAAAEDGARDSASKKADALGREVKSLQKEREEIRTRLGRLLELLEGLE